MNKIKVRSSYINGEETMIHREVFTTIDDSREYFVLKSCLAFNMTLDEKNQYRNRDAIHFHSINGESKTVRAYCRECDAAVNIALLKPPYRGEDKVSSPSANECVFRIFITNHSCD